MEGLNITQLESLKSKDQAALLDTVDEIRRHGVNRYISLPQLIVCGDQSSGKSSVLEAISGVHSPVDDGLCTRFTTEVILRRAPGNLASVKLVPSKEASLGHRAKLSQFQKSSISHAEIPTLISEAKAIMGLTGSSSFSRDILQLEVSGPKLPHLTLVDLPGLIHHPNKEQTEEDVKIPRDLVRKYMSQPRSVVLAIVTAKNDTSNQVVLQMAKEADPQGVRTMGIITKPDCLIRDSPNESAFFALASNKETYFKLDWHILRNGNFNERKDPNFNRDEAEKEFFATGIWKNLPSSKRGVDALRTRLSHVLYQQIQRELPSLLKEIEHELVACKTVLDRLGSPRDTPSSRRQYLTDIANRFHDLVQAGNEGNYQDSFFKIDDSKLEGFFSFVITENNGASNRLRATLRREEQKFLDRMYNSGHTYEILDDVPATPFSNRGGPIYITEASFLHEISVLLDHSKGRELPGTFTPLLVGDLFLRQSKNWKAIAMEFTEEVWNIVKRFLDQVLTHVADENVRHAILEEIIDPAMEEKLSRLREKVTELHSPYSKGYPSTLNPRFVRKLEKKRYQQLSSPAENSENDEEDPNTYACRELLYLMQAYYAVALDVFVDNVASLGVENCLMAELKDLLSPLTVSGMTDEMLEVIAFESDDVRELRSQMSEKQKSLQKSFELCRRQARKLASNRLNAGAQNTAPMTESLKEKPTEKTSNAQDANGKSASNLSSSTAHDKDSSENLNETVSSSIKQNLPKSEQPKVGSLRDPTVKLPNSSSTSNQNTQGTPAPSLISSSIIPGKGDFGTWSRPVLKNVKPDVSSSEQLGFGISNSGIGQSQSTLTSGTGLFGAKPAESKPSSNFGGSNFGSLSEFGQSQSMRPFAKSAESKPSSNLGGSSFGSSSEFGQSQSMRPFRTAGLFGAKPAESKPSSNVGGSMFGSSPEIGQSQSTLPFGSKSSESKSSPAFGGGGSLFGSPPESGKPQAAATRPLFGSPSSPPPGSGSNGHQVSLSNSTIITTSTPSTVMPLVSSTSSNSQKAPKKVTEFSYFENIPTSLGVSPDRFITTEIDSYSNTTLCYQGMTYAIHATHQPEEIRLKDYYNLGKLGY